MTNTQGGIYKTSSVHPVTAEPKHGAPAESHGTAVATLPSRVLCSALWVMCCL